MTIRDVICVLLSVIFGTVSVLNADDAAAPSADPITEWKTLVEEMDQFKKSMEGFTLQYSKGTPSEKSKIRKDANLLNTKFQTITYPRMVELAPQINKLDPDDTVAAELMLQTIFSKNQYEELIRISDKVLQKDPKAQLAANFNGAARFATHDFEGAVKVLKAAEENGILIPTLGGQYLDSAEKYLEYWKEEQEIRAKEDAAQGDDQLPIVKLSTSKGDIEILMFENEAPNTVANFINLVEKKFYDGIKFHRVLPNFMAQGGCPNSRDNPALAGQGGPGYRIECEAYAPNARRHFAGSLSMAHAGKDTGGSQFFLTHLPTDHLNPEPGKQMGVHTVFGRVIKGLDVVQALEVNDVINTATVVRKRNHEYTPKTLPENQ